MGKKKATPKVAEGPSDEEIAERYRENRREDAAEDRAQAIQYKLGVAAVAAGLPLVGWTVIYPSLISAVLAGGIFVVGIIVAVPAARPFIIKIIERLPGVKDLPDDG